MTNYTPPGYVSLQEAFVSFAQETFADEIADIEQDHQQRVRAATSRIESETSDPVRSAVATQGMRPDLTPIMERSFVAFRDRLCQGEIVACFRGFGSQLTTIEPQFWETERGGRALASGRYQTFFDDAPVWVASPKCEDNKPVNRGGRHPSADWDAVRELLRLKINEEGFPTTDNRIGWRSQADVERWIAVVLQDRRESVGETTIRNRAREMLSALRTET